MNVVNYSQHIESKCKQRTENLLHVFQIEPAKYETNSRTSHQTSEQSKYGVSTLRVKQNSTTIPGFPNGQRVYFPIIYCRNTG